MASAAPQIPQQISQMPQMMQLNQQPRAQIARTQQQPQLTSYGATNLANYNPSQRYVVNQQKQQQLGNHHQVQMNLTNNPAIRRSFSGPVPMNPVNVVQMARSLTGNPQLNSSNNPSALQQQQLQQQRNLQQRQMMNQSANAPAKMNSFSDSLSLTTPFSSSSSNSFLSSFSSSSSSASSSSSSYSSLFSRPAQRSNNKSFAPQSLLNDDDDDDDIFGLNGGESAFAATQDIRLMAKVTLLRPTHLLHTPIHLHTDTLKFLAYFNYYFIIMLIFDKIFLLISISYLYLCIYIYIYMYDCMVIWCVIGRS